MGAHGRGGDLAGPRRPGGCARHRDRAAREARARGLRDEPRDEAGATPPPGAAADRPGARRRARLGRGSDRRCAEAAPPGFLNLRLRSDALGATIDGILAAPEVGPHPARACTPGGCRVRLGEPDRAADRRQRAGGVRRRPAQPCPRGRRPGGDTRVLLQRLGRRRSRSWARRSPRSPAASPSRRTATTAGTCATSRRPCRPTCGNARWPAMRRSTRSSGPGRPARPRGHRGEPRTSGRPFRRLDDRGVAPRGRLGRAGGRPPARQRPHLRARWRAVVPRDGVRRRQGPGDLPRRRAADVLRGGYRLRHGEVLPRLRPPHLHLGLGSPRHGRPGPRCRRGDGL